MLQQRHNLGRRFGTNKMHLSPQWLLMLSVLRRWFCCFDSLLIVNPILGVCSCSMFVRYILVLQSSRWGRKSWMLCFVCLPGVSWLLCGSWVCLQFVIVVSPDHSHLLSWLENLGAETGRCVSLSHQHHIWSCGRASSRIYTACW